MLKIQSSSEVGKWMVTGSVLQARRGNYFRTLRVHWAKPCNATGRMKDATIRTRGLEVSRCSILELKPNCRFRKIFIHPFWERWHGLSAYRYRPYCCKSPQVSIREDKCRNFQISPGNGRQVRYFMPATRLLRRLNCQYVKSDDGR